MAKPRKKRRQPRQIETSLPKRQYKRTNRMLYAVSAVLLVVFGGGAALLGAGAPKSPAPTPVPTVAPATSGSAADQTQQFTATPTPVPPTATPGQ
ncbi:MAG: hypothetical protein M1380_10205 [Chloroflexi bacterium]|nr:hypothetical protein [Chloroflexota bacterium]